MKYLPDTNVWVEYLRGQNTQLRTRFEACQPSQIWISTVAIFELEHGALVSANPSRNIAAVRSLYSGFMVLDFDHQCSQRAASVYAELALKGMKLDQMDVFLAASALVHDLTLVTHNKRHFARVPSLKLDDWQ